MRYSFSPGFLQLLVGLFTTALWSTDVGAAEISLRATVQRALLQAPDLRPAAQRLQGQQDALESSRGRLPAAPRLGLLFGGRQIVDQGLRPELGLELSQELSWASLGEKRRNGGERAKELALTELNEVELSVVREAALCWAELRKAEKRVEFAERTLKRAQKLHELVEARTALGVDSSLESSLSAAALSRATHLLEQSHLERELAEFELRVLLEVPMKQPIYTGKEEPLPPRTESSFEQHPYVQVSLRAAKQLDAEAELQLAGGAPRWDVGASVLREGTGDWLVLGRVSIPLGSLNSQAYDAAQTRARVEPLRLEASHRAERLERKARVLRGQIRRQELLVESIRRGELALAKRAVETARFQFEAGKATVPLLLSVAERAAAAEENLIEAQDSLLRGRIEESWTTGALLGWARQ